MSTKFFLIIIMTVFSLKLNAQSQINTKVSDTKMVLVTGGYYTPLFRQKGNSEKELVRPFYLDIHAVTNAQFLRFVKANSEWSRSKVKKIFADGSYLKDWQGDFNPGKNVNSSAPVTYVSWFAAKAYSKWVGKRLPTLAEWEFVAMAGENSPGPKKDKKFNERLIRWYSAELPQRLNDVMTGDKNYWGVYDMFGLIREWTFDFNTTNINGTAICGGGSAGATDLTNYPAFLRYGFNSCLSANSDLGNLGFRCAKNAE
jgi:formylglycine-generating enzyme required for sulfatase activity